MTTRTRQSWRDRWSCLDPLCTAGAGQGQGDRFALLMVPRE